MALEFGCKRFFTQHITKQEYNRYEFKTEFCYKINTITIWQDTPGLTKVVADSSKFNNEDKYPILDGHRKPRKSKLFTLEPLPQQAN